MFFVRIYFHFKPFSTFQLFSKICPALHKQTRLRSKKMSVITKNTAGYKTNGKSDTNYWNFDNFWMNFTLTPTLNVCTSKSNFFLSCNSCSVPLGIIPNISIIESEWIPFEMVLILWENRDISGLVFGHINYDFIQLHHC